MNVKNRKNLLANANEVTVIQFGKGTNPKILIVSVTGLISAKGLNLSGSKPNPCLAILSIETPFDLIDITSADY